MSTDDTMSRALDLVKSGAVLGDMTKGKRVPADYFRTVAHHDIPFTGKPGKGTQVGGYPVGKHVAGGKAPKGMSTEAAPIATHGEATVHKIGDKKFQVRHTSGTTKHATKAGAIEHAKKLHAKDKRAASRAAKGRVKKAEEIDVAKASGPVSKKIKKLIAEGKPQDQAVAIALDMQRRGELEKSETAEDRALALVKGRNPHAADTVRCGSHLMPQPAYREPSCVTPPPSLRPARDAALIRAPRDAAPTPQRAGAGVMVDPRSGLTK